MLRVYHAFITIHFLTRIPLVYVCIAVVYVCIDVVYVFIAVVCMRVIYVCFYYERNQINEF